MVYYYGSDTMQAKIKARLEINCCGNLYVTLRQRLLAATKPPCAREPCAGTREANEIRNYYQARGKCCDRISWERCA